MESEENNSCNGSLKSFHPQLLFDSCQRHLDRYDSSSSSSSSYSSFSPSIVLHVSPMEIAFSIRVQARAVSSLLSVQSSTHFPASPLKPLSNPSMTPHPRPPPRVVVVRCLARRTPTASWGIVRYHTPLLPTSISSFFFCFHFPFVLSCVSLSF